MVDNANAWLEFDGNPAADNTFNGLSARMQAGEDVEIYALVYVHSDGKIKEADASAIGTMPVIGLATAAIANNAVGVVILQGL